MKRILKHIMVVAVVIAVIACLLSLTPRGIKPEDQTLQAGPTGTEDVQPTTTPTPSPIPTNRPTYTKKMTEPIITATPEPTPTGPAMTYLGRYYVVGYDVCIECCGKTDGITASGTLATVGRTVAANGPAFGTRLYIEGIGERVVEDRGGMKGNVLDVLCSNHTECYAITGHYDVYIIED